jgi:predicted MFS family arabinose efflux permease
MIDAVGPRRAIAMSRATSLGPLYLSYGVLGGAGFAGAGILTVSVLVPRRWRDNRGTALTLISTGSSLGQAVAYQAASWLILTHGWRAASAVFGGLLALLLPVCLALLADGPPAAPAERRPVPAATGLLDVVTGRTFRLLVGAYLACGFTHFMITTHLAALAVDRGLGAAIRARALSVLAVANVIGLLAAGQLADQLGNRRTLAAAYAIRALALTLLWFVGGRSAFYVFAFCFGLTFFTTAPLTSALIGERYRLALTKRVFGAANAVHHLAGAAGAYLAGAVFDLTASYLPVFVLGAAMVYLAAGLTWRLGEPARRDSRA